MTLRWAYNNYTTPDLPNFLVGRGSRSAISLCEAIGNTDLTKILLTALQYATSLSPAYEKAVSDDSKLKTDWSLSEGAFESSREQLYTIEAQILRVLGFQTHVALPHALCINYLQTLQVFKSPEGPALAKRAIKLLNTALLSPQQLYLTHQPPALATAAIYLAAREEEVNLPDVEWWEVFDVDREELGFLVVALTSVEGFAVQEKRFGGREKYR